jgi:uncharacterized protein YwgA
MNRQQIALRLALEDGGLPVSTATFEDRLITQKVVYLIQQRGVHLGYPFHWYIRGPYSSDLTADVFSLAAAMADSDTRSHSWKLDEKSRNRISRLRKIWVAKRDTSERARWLELVASVHFLVDQKPGRLYDVLGLRKTLRRFKKIFSADEIKAAISALKAHHLA